MDTMKRTVFKKAKLAAAIALTSSTLAMTGCLVEGDDAESVSNSNTSSALGNNHQRVTAPKGSVMGIVQDTNGNPISGATVYIGSTTAVTTDGGTYQFDDVAAVQLQVAGVANYAGDAVQIVIVPPQGYLGATVTVTPTAVLDAGQAEDSSDVATASTSTFVDGFSANAGTAVLPALTASVKGHVQDNVTGSHELLVGESIALDMLSVNTVSQQQVQNGVSTSYQTLSYTSVIDADGDFLIENAPADSLLDFVFEDFKISDGSVENVTTIDEQLAVNIDTIEVTPIAPVDTVAPFVVGVDNIVDKTKTPGLLKDDVTNQLVIHFSEGLTGAAVDQIGSDDANSVIIRDVDANGYLEVASLVVTGSQLTITLTQDLTPGNIIHVNLLKSDFMDQAATPNTLIKSDAVGFNDNASSTNENDYLRLILKTFTEDDLEAVTPTLAQHSLDVTLDDIGLVQLSSTAFNDVVDGDEEGQAGIQQLNSAENNDGLLNDASQRLGALASALNKTIGGGAIAVETNVARISFAPTSASKYEMKVYNANGADAGTVNSAKFVGVEQGSTGSAFKADGTGTVIEAVLTNVEPGYSVEITPFDELGYPGNSHSMMLVDNVAPTTILQDSYGILVTDEGNSDSSGVVSLEYGDGGEQASGEEVNVGAPYFNLTPRLLGQVDGTDDGANDESDDINTFVGMYELNTKNKHASDVISNKDPEEHYIDPDLNIYDANAYASYVASGEKVDGESGQLRRTVSVAFSEDVTLTAAPVFDGVSADSIVAGSFVAAPDIARDDNGGMPGTESETDAAGAVIPADAWADLIRFDIEDVYQFSKNENGSVLDFQNAIQDVAVNPNAGATNAKVVFRDMIPALVTEASYLGDRLIVKFDKAVVIDADDSIELNLGGVSISLANEEDFSLNEDGMTLTVYPDAWGGGSEMTIATAFNLGRYNQASPASDEFDGDINLTHAKLNFSEVETATGVSWKLYNDGIHSKDYGFEEPQFAVVNELFDFEVDGDAQIGAGDDEIELTLTSTHRIDFDGIDISDSDVLKGFINWSGGAIDEISEVIETKPEGKEEYKYKATLTLESAASEADEITFSLPGSSWTSAYDNTLIDGVDPIDVED